MSYLCSEWRLKESHPILGDLYPVAWWQEGIKAQNEVWVPMK